MSASQGSSLHLVVVTGSESNSPVELSEEAGEHPELTVSSEPPGEVEDQISTDSGAGIDCLLVPQTIGDLDGVEFIASVRERDQDVPIVLLVESNRGDVVPEAFDSGVTETLPQSTLHTRPDAVVDRATSLIRNNGAARSSPRIEEEREKYATLVEQSSDGIVVVQDEQYVFVNEQFCELTGYPREELIGKLFYEVFTPEYRDLVKERYHQRVAGESPPRRYAVDVETAEGEVRTFDLAVSSIQHEGAPATMANFRDVTDQRELEQTYREVFEGVSDGLVVHDPETGEMLRVNHRFCELTGYDRDELIGETVDLINPPGYSYEEAQQRIERARDEGSLLFEWKNEPKEGDPHPVEVHLRTVQIRGEERVLASVRDITERKRREREYEQIFNGVNDIVNVYDPDAGDLVAVNDTMCEVTGYDRETLLNGGVGLVSAADEGFTADRAATIIDDVIESGEPRSLEWQIETADGEKRWLDVRAAPATVGGEDRVLTISRDVTDRRRTERRLEAILDRIDEAIFLAKVSELDSASPAPDYLSSGYEEIWGQPLSGLHETYEEGFFGTLHPEDAEGYRAFIDDILEDVNANSERNRYTREYRIERPDGEVRWVHSDFYPLDWPGGEPRIVILSRDITDRKQRERRMSSFEEATDKLATADTTIEAARSAIDAATETLGLPGVAAFFYDEATGDLAAEVVSEPLTDALESASVSSGSGPLWEAFATGTVVTADDADQRLMDGIDELTDWRAIALGSHGVLLVGSWGDSVDSDTIQSAHILAATLEAALNHLRSEEQLEEQQAELETQTERAKRLERVARLTQQVEKAITEASTRRGIEESVCEQLTDIDPYEVAWIGAADVGTDRLTPHVVSGESSAVQSVDLTDESDPHPAVEAWQTNEVRVVEGLVAGGPQGGWRERSLQAGHQTLCAIPLTHTGRTHGVLVIGASLPNLFSGPERAAFEQLGSSIGNALTAVERRRALESDDTTQLEFRGEESRLRFADVAGALTCTVRHARTVRRDDGSVSVYYELDGDVPDTDAAVDAIEAVYPGNAELNVVTQEASRLLVEVRQQSWFGSLLADYGGVLRRAEATADETIVTVELPVGVDVRSFVEQLQEQDPALELVARRQHQQPDRTPQETLARLRDRLTDRQLEVLETALASGYFEWPRDHSAEEVADTLDIAQPTLTKHLRLAERKTFETVLDPK